MIKFVFFVLPFLFSVPLSAQIGSQPDAWINTGTVQAHISAFGPLVDDFRSSKEEGQPLASGIREMSLWLGGLDAAGNLLLSIQEPDSVKSDLQGGFRGTPQSARVWKVTKAQIDQHRKDFADNGVIDNPIPEIFAWPARKNPHSLTHNGFSADSIGMLSAPAMIRWWADLYDPAEGDFPFSGNIFNNTQRQPDELLFVPFHTKTTSAHWPGKRTFNVNGSVLFFTYYCDDVDFLDNTVFGYLTLQFNIEGEERMDSLFLSFKVDGQIENPLNDYLGINKLSSTAFFYNADTSRVVQSDLFPPMVMFNLKGGLVDTFGMVKKVFSAIPLHSKIDSSILFGQRPPRFPNEYFNYITGHWRDERPITIGGTGHQDWGLGIPTNFVFPDPPFVPSGWSEITAENPPGDRAVLLSSGPVVIREDFTRVHHIPFSFSIISGEKSLSRQWQKTKEFPENHALFFYGDFIHDPFDTLPCFSTTFAGSRPSFEAAINCFPNPVSAFLYVSAGAGRIEEVFLCDLIGRHFPVPAESRLTDEDGNMILNVQVLPGGIYFLSGRLEDGQYFVKKVMIVR